MANRIFPNNTQISMGSKIEFQGINWDEVSSSMKNNRFAEDKTQAVLDLLAKAGIELSPNQEEEITDIVQQLSEDTEPLEESEDKDLSPDSQKTKDDFMIGDGDGDADDGFMTMKISTNNNNMRKIAFTHPNQISAEAIEKALASGDKRLANTILAARKENRLKIAQKINEQAQQALRKSQVNNENIIEPAMPDQAGGENDSAYQEGFSAGQAASGGMPGNDKGYTGQDLYKYMEGFFAAQSQQKDGMDTETQNVPNADMAGQMPDMSGEIIPPTTAFTSPSKFTQAQRASFKKIAVSLGFPKEYVDAMCGKSQKQLPEQLNNLNGKIKEVYSSNISENTKNSLIKSLIKEAKLTPDSKAEFVRFWNEILGYQDKSYWPSVAEDYTETK